MMMMMAQDYRLKRVIKNKPLTGLRIVCFAFATDIRLFLAAHKPAAVHENKSLQQISDYSAVRHRDDEDGRHFYLQQGACAYVTT